MKSWLRAPRSGGTALRFILNPAWSQGRPHFIRPTLGWRAESLWDRAPGNLDAFAWMPVAVAAAAADSPAVEASAVASPAASASTAAAAAAAAGIEYANGVTPSSPGLRAPRYLGNPSPPSTNPTGVAARTLSAPPRGAKSGIRRLPNREEKPVPAKVESVVQPMGFEFPEAEFLLLPGGVDKDVAAVLLGAGRGPKAAMGGRSDSLPAAKGGRLCRSRLSVDGTA